MSFNITSIGVFLPERMSKNEIEKKSPNLVNELNNRKMKSISIASDDETVTSMGEKSSRIALLNAGIAPQDIDQFVFISEGISDTLYMDTSKAIVKRLNKKAGGSIHVNDYFKGSNGTIGLIDLISNQVESNPDINYSLICSSVIWKYHSNNRILGKALLGDGAGTIVLSKDGKSCRNQVISSASVSLSDYNMISGFRYGGTEHDITQEVIRDELFKIEILNKTQYKQLEQVIIERCKELIHDVLKKADILLENINYIGISGTEKNKVNQILDFCPKDINVINSLNINGYLGSVGVFDILNLFINDSNIPINSKMLVVSFGVDSNIESMIIKK